MPLFLIFAVLFANTPQANVDPQFMFNLIGGISILLNLAIAIRKAMGGGEKQLITNHPLVVSVLKEFASASAFGRHVTEDRAEHRRLQEDAAETAGHIYTKIDQVKESVLLEGRERETRLHGTIEKLVGAVGELRGQVEQMNRRKGA